MKIRMQINDVRVRRMPQGGCNGSQTARVKRERERQEAKVEKLKWKRSILKTTR